MSRIRSCCLFGLSLSLSAALAFSQAPPPVGSVDFQALSQEATGWLAGLVRINTVNPPGNELAGAHYLEAILQKEGIPSEIIETAPGRGALVARLNSGAFPDPSRALLLLGHMDVVGVDASKWTQEPFSAAQTDGFLWGRGSLDDKGPLIANLAAFIELKRAGVHLSRDVIFLADGDEEQGGDFGIRALAEKHWDKIAAAFCINEGGRTIVKDGKPWYVGVQASEKVSVNYRVIATGTSGHASVPLKDNAVVHLAAAIEKLGNWETPIKLTVATKRYFEGLAQIEDPELAKWMRVLDTPERQDHAARILAAANPVWSAMLRDTVSPTILQAGVRSNVIPSEARATLNVRLIPGELPGDFADAMLKVVGDPQIRIEIESINSRPSPPSDIDTPLYASIVKAAKTVLPGAPILPMMSTGFTDSAELRMRNVTCYGLMPFPLTEDQVARMHADNERLPLSSIRPAVELVYRSVEDFVRAP
ncbi:MAG TPA: M20/M25/M40 family metallo-hydrolase [Candidatus Acidoferrales bacterium]|nr:M20/M25/M40 family metallo-hydrolase [Candidatus Acidoferrales bacterium]